ncbi:carboxymuconolactone decarboxylase family protein [Rubrobacter aplysinae]|uniref:carboxymuconolactone decarboxylase family protein n=1 Tax=Rubrobacter aplysinae TaxID=909625 RepID=UPI00069F1709|nr:hypothetical protein [Rubrobacter aplysinae]
MGLDESERGKVQRFESGDPGRAALLRFAYEVDETRGHPSDDAFGSLRDAGYTDEQTLEIIAHVALTTYSNYMNDSIGTELDIPVVEPVQGS